MADFEHENPYASPQTAAEPMRAASHGIWRDGDDMLVASGAKAPKACWVTNEERGVLRNRIGCPSLLHSLFLYLTLAALILTSCTGFLVVVALWAVLLLRGFVREGSILAWLSWRLTLRRVAGGGINIVLFVTGLSLCTLGLESGNSAMALVIVPLAVVTIASMTYADRLLTGLYAWRGEDGIVRVRGVHPDYLARLPAYNESDLTLAKIVEPGDSPFADPTS